MPPWYPVCYYYFLIYLNERVIQKAQNLYKVANSLYKSVHMWTNCIHQYKHRITIETNFCTHHSTMHQVFIVHKLLFWCLFYIQLSKVFSYCLHFFPLEVNNLVCLADGYSHHKLVVLTKISINMHKVLFICYFF